MFMKIINDIENSLKADCYFAALALALTLPDICGKAEYGDISCKKRYTKWYNKNMGQDEKCPTQPYEQECPYMSGEVAYSLRNCFLHQGTPTVDKNKIREECCKIDRFILRLQKENPWIIASNSASVSNFGPHGYNGNALFREYTVDVRGFCKKLCLCAEGYYQKNPEKFNFFNYEIE